MEFRTNHASEILNSLNRERNAKKEFCDFTIKAGRQTFPVHKCVIGTYSSFFKTLFTSEMKEKYASEANVKGVSGAMMAFVLNFIYTSYVIITGENVYEMLEAAEFLQVPTLKGFCGTFLIKHINLQNCLKARTYANRYNMKSLAEVTNEYISKNLSSVLKSKRHCNLEIDDVKSLFSLKNSQASIEEDKYNGLVNWIKHDFDARRSHFSDLFAFLDLERLSKILLKTVVLKEKLVSESKECLQLLLMTLADRVLETDTCGTSQCQRDGHTGEILVIGGNSCPQSVVKYNVNTKEWSALPDTNLVRKWASAVNYDRHVYLMGGSPDDGQTKHDSNEMLDLHMPTIWYCNVPLMNSGRDTFAAAVLNDKIYCVGGCAQGRMSKAECYDCKAGKWTELSKMNEVRSHHALVAANGLLFAIGGYNKNCKATNAVECFDPKINKWNHIARMASGRVGLCAVELNDEVYAIGGFGGNNQCLSSIEKYSLETKKWIAVASMNEARRGGSACVVNGKIYVFGGQGVNTVEVYDPAAMKWNIETHMTQKRGFLSVVAL